MHQHAAKDPLEARLPNDHPRHPIDPRRPSLDDRPATSHRLTVVRPPDAVCQHRAAESVSFPHPGQHHRTRAGLVGPELGWWHQRPVRLLTRDRLAASLGPRLQTDTPGSGPAVTQAFEFLNLNCDMRGDTQRHHGGGGVQDTDARGPLHDDPVALREPRL